MGLDGSEESLANMILARKQSRGQQVGILSRSVEYSSDPDIFVGSGAGTVAARSGSGSDLEN